jgi:hypothetical protein
MSNGIQVEEYTVFTKKIIKYATGVRSEFDRDGAIDGNLVN